MAKEFSSPVSLQVTQQKNEIIEGSGFETDLNPQSIYKELVEQVRNEWNYCYRVQNSKVQKWLDRLKIYNNQKRDDDAVGDTLLFTVHNSILAALYEDQLSVEFSGRNEGNEDIAFNLNSLAEYDYDEMGKDQLDYFWLWDTLFFGKGYILFTSFDRKLMIPKPELVDPTTWMQDPEATTLNKNMWNRNSARFCGHEILLTKPDMEDVPSVFDTDFLKVTKSTNSLVDQARQSRQDAQGLNQQIKTEEKDLGVNAYHYITEWMTHFKHPVLTGGKTKKVLVWLGNDRSKLIRFKVLKQQDRWPGIERSIFPSSHDFYGTSVPDLIEDKQRMRAVLMNLGIQQLKADLFGRFLYNRGKIKSRGDLNYDFQKHIGVDLKPGESINNIISPVPNTNINQSYFNLLMNIIDAEAQRATATPDMQQGMLSKQDRTLGELNKADAKGGIRYSLASKIFGWSDKDFWGQWYWLYKTYFKAVIDEKIIKINSIFGPKFKALDRGKIIGKTDPDIKILSKYLTESQRAKQRQLLNEFGQILLQTKDTNIRYYLRESGKLHGFSEEQLNQLLPPTPDEMKALEENETLSDDKIASVSPSDNDMEHLVQHSKARKTKALYAHVATHWHAMELKKKNPDQFPGNQQQQQGQDSAKQSTADTLQKLLQKRQQQPNASGEQGGMTIQ